MKTILSKENEMMDLAINGGMPLRMKPFASWPFFGSDEIAAVSGVLQSGNVNYWTGEECLLFEKEFASSIGVEYAVAMMNGTVALEATLMALNISNGDEVIVTHRSYIASARVVRK